MVKVGGKKSEAVSVLKAQAFACAWQAWRIPIRPSSREIDLQAFVTAAAAEDVKVTCNGYFIPKDL